MRQVVINVLTSQGTQADQLLGKTLAEIERYYCEKTLETTGDNREAAAKILGIGERSLYRMLKRWKNKDKNLNSPITKESPQ